MGTIRGDGPLRVPETPPPVENELPGNQGKGTALPPNAATPGPTTGGVSRPYEPPPETYPEPRPGEGATEPKLAEMPPPDEPPPMGGISIRYCVVISAGMSLGTVVTAFNCPSDHAARLTIVGSLDWRALTRPGTISGSLRF